MKYFLQSLLIGICFSGLHLDSNGIDRTSTNGSSTLPVNETTLLTSFVDQCDPIKAMTAAPVCQRALLDTVAVYSLRRIQLIPVLTCCARFGLNHCLSVSFSTGNCVGSEESLEMAVSNIRQLADSVLPSTNDYDWPPKDIMGAKDGICQGLFGFFNSAIRKIKYKEPYSSVNNVTKEVAERMLREPARESVFSLIEDFEPEMLVNELMELEEAKKDASNTSLVAVSRRGARCFFDVSAFDESMRQNVATFNQFVANTTRDFLLTVNATHEAQTKFQAQSNKNFQDFVDAENAILGIATRTNAADGLTDRSGFDVGSVTFLPNGTAVLELGNNGTLANSTLMKNGNETVQHQLRNSTLANKTLSNETIEIDISNRTVANETSTNSTTPINGTVIFAEPGHFNETNNSTSRIGARLGNETIEIVFTNATVGNESSSNSTNLNNGTATETGNNTLPDNRTITNASLSIANGTSISNGSSTRSGPIFARGLELVVLDGIESTTEAAHGSRSLEDLNNQTMFTNEWLNLVALSTSNSTLTINDLFETWVVNNNAMARESWRKAVDETTHFRTNFGNQTEQKHDPKSLGGFENATLLTNELLRNWNESLMFTTDWIGSSLLALNSSNSSLTANDLFQTWVANNNVRTQPKWQKAFDETTNFWANFEKPEQDVESLGSFDNATLLTKKILRNWNESLMFTTDWIGSSLLALNSSKSSLTINDLFQTWVANNNARTQQNWQKAIDETANFEKPEQDIESLVNFDNATLLTTLRNLNESFFTTDNGTTNLLLHGLGVGHQHVLKSLDGFDNKTLFNNEWINLVALTASNSSLAVDDQFAAWLANNNARAQESWQKAVKDATSFWANFENQTKKQEHVPKSLAGFDNADRNITSLLVNDRFPSWLNTSTAEAQKNWNNLVATTTLNSTVINDQFQKWVDDNNALAKKNWEKFLKDTSNFWNNVEKETSGANHAARSLDGFDNADRNITTLLINDRFQNWVNKSNAEAKRNWGNFVASTTINSTLLDDRFHKWVADNNAQIRKNWNKFVEDQKVFWADVNKGFVGNEKNRDARCMVKTTAFDALTTSFQDSVANASADALAALNGTINSTRARSLEYPEDDSPCSRWPDLVDAVEESVNGSSEFNGTNLLDLLVDLDQLSLANDSLFEALVDNSFVEIVLNNSDVDGTDGSNGTNRNARCFVFTKQTEELLRRFTNSAAANAAISTSLASLNATIFNRTRARSLNDVEEVYETPCEKMADRVNTMMVALLRSSEAIQSNSTRDFIDIVVEEPHNPRNQSVARSLNDVEEVYETPCEKMADRVNTMMVALLRSSEAIQSNSTRDFIDIVVEEPHNQRNQSVARMLNDVETEVTSTTKSPVQIVKTVESFAEWSNATNAKIEKGWQDFVNETKTFWAKVANDLRIPDASNRNARCFVNNTVMTKLLADFAAAMANRSVLVNNSRSGAARSLSEFDPELSNLTSCEKKLRGYFIELAGSQETSSNSSEPGFDKIKLLVETLFNNTHDETPVSNGTDGTHFTLLVTGLVDNSTDSEILRTNLDDSFGPGWDDGNDVGPSIIQDLSTILVNNTNSTDSEVLGTNLDDSSGPSWNDVIPDIIQFASTQSTVTEPTTNTSVVIPTVPGSVNVTSSPGSRGARQFNLFNFSIPFSVNARPPPVSKPTSKHASKPKEIWMEESFNSDESDLMNSIRMMSSAKRTSTTKVIQLVTVLLPFLRYFKIINFVL